jgi:hypothetical protein
MITKFLGLSKMTSNSHTYYNELWRSIPRELMQDYVNEEKERWKYGRLQLSSDNVFIDAFILMLIVNCLAIPYIYLFDGDINDAGPAAGFIFLIGLVVCWFRKKQYLDFYYKEELYHLYLFLDKHGVKDTL